MDNNKAHSQTGERKIHLDFLRILAIFMVLFNHTQTKGFLLFTVAQDSPFYYFYMSVAILIKMAVPLFFMISGALLLPKDEPVHNVLRNRVLRFLIILVVCSFISYLYSLHWKFSDLSFSYFFKTLYSDRITVPYWYLYSYLAYLLMLPLLRKFVKALNNHDFIYIIAAYSFIQSLRIIQFIIWKSDVTFSHYFSLFVVERTVFWPSLGYYLEYRLDQKDCTKQKCIILVIASMVSVFVCCVLTQYNWLILNKGDHNFSQTFLNILTYIQAITVYYISKLWFSKHTLNSRISKVISSIGSCTFGIYLFEQIYRNKTRKIFDILFPYLHSLPSCIIWIFTACMLGLGITWCLKHIPIIKKYI